MAAAHAGAHCCHVDASKGMVQWARDNAELNGLSDHPIRWIVDDVNKFLQRETRFLFLWKILNYLCILKQGA